MLICPVRNCRLALAREEKRLACPQGHSFDVARSGYINLLQPQERRSKQPGDTPVAVEARQRLHDRGVTKPLLDAIGETIAASPDEVVLDAGCGDGFYLGTLANRVGFQAHGIDISIPAIQAAARRFPPTHGRFEWIVANADRSVPYADASFSVVLSITARMNAAEFRRVLRDDGRLLVAVASPLDLMELRGQGLRMEVLREEALREEESQQGAPAALSESEKAERGILENIGRDRVPRTLETFAREFKLVDQRRVTTTADLDVEAVRDVLVSIYRPLRSQPVEAMRVTFSLDLLLFRPA
jgi:23S rRNA (guanine745-N1)-methyltransferase